MAWSPAESNEAAPERSGVDRNLAVTMVMRNPDANTEDVGDRATQICEVVAAMSPAVSEEEPSIEAYMEALLQRARQGQSTNAELTIPLPARAKQEPVPAPVAVASTAPTTETPIGAAAPPQPAECRIAISEMRQLANASTWNTFHSQLGSRLVCEMRWNGLVAVGSIVTSVVLLGLSPSARSPIFYSAVVATVVAATWVLKFFATSRLLQCVNSEVEAQAQTTTG